jgi:hypothetical protein
MDVDGRISQVRCKVCSFVERREKLLVAKIHYGSMLGDVKRSVILR